MKAWLRSLRGIQGLALAGLAIALAGTLSWGQTFPEEMAEQSEPPMAEPPLSPRPPDSPLPPSSLPPPTPLPPEQAAPSVPAAPSPYSPPEWGGIRGGAVPPAPVVRLRVQAPARVQADKEIEYRLTVENVSAADAHHVLVRDRLPRGVEGPVRAEPKATEQKKTKDGDTDLLWELGTLKAGEQKVIVLTVKPKGNEDVQNRAYVQFEHGQKVTTRIAKPSVRVKAAAPSQAVRYEAFSFRIEVVNTGPVPLQNVVVTDELPAELEFVSGKPEPNGEKPLTWKLGDIAPNQTRRIEYQVISKQTGTFRNSTKATAGGGVSAADQAAVTVGEAKLKISISGPPRRLVNRPIPYHITVGNLGSVPLTNVQVSDELPGGVEFVSANGGGRREGGFVRWSLGNLKPGELRPLLLVLRASRPGWCWNEVRAQAMRPQAEQGSGEIAEKARSEATRIEPALAPAIEIDKNTDWLIVGQRATYTIRLFNPGKNNVLYPSVLIDVPDQMSITAERGETTAQRQGQRVRFDPLKVLGRGEEKTYTVEVEAKKAGEAKLRAWWTDGRREAGPPETWDDKTIILDPARVASRIASEMQSERARCLLGALARHLLSALAQPRSPCWTRTDAPPTIP